jgi:hypothetical protein
MQGKGNTYKTNAMASSLFPMTIDSWLVYTLYASSWKANMNCFSSSLSAIPVLDWRNACSSGLRSNMVRSSSGNKSEDPFTSSIREDISVQVGEVARNRERL